MFRSQLSLLQRPLLEKFWTHIVHQQPKGGGADFSKLEVLPVLEAMTHRNGGGLSCNINGVVGDAKTAEDFFVVLLSGFDVSSVQFFPADDRSKTLDGTLHLVHSRPFLSWKPIAPPTPEEPFSAVLSNHFNVPFSMSGEVCDEQFLTHLTLKCPLEAALVDAGCPKEIAECTANPEAMKMLVSLRRVKVKPEMITFNAIKSVSRTQPKWSSALGIL